MAIFVVRHAKAGDRENWADDDALRPLSKPGRAQADALIDLYADYEITAVYSSPFLRCMQTVEPLARARSLSMKTSPALAEGAGLEAAWELMSAHDDSVFCTHGDIVAELLDDLIARRIIRSEEARAEKGSTWKIELKDGALNKAAYIPPP